MKHIEEWNKVMKRTTSSELRNFYLFLITKIPPNIKTKYIGYYDFNGFLDQLIAQYFFPEDAL